MSNFNCAISTLRWKKKRLKTKQQKEELNEAIKILTKAGSKNCVRGRK